MAKLIIKLINSVGEVLIKIQMSGIDSRLCSYLTTT